MTFIHFINCATLTFGPLFAIYKASKLRDSLSLLYAGLFYILAQFGKLFLLATFVPAPEDDSFQISHELMVAYTSTVDLVVLYIFLNNKQIRGNFKSQLIYVCLGWAAGESLLERLGPLWIGARATEFNWDFILLSLGATLSIFYFWAIGASVWLWTKSNLSSSTSTVVVLNFALYCTLPVIFKYLESVVEIGTIGMLGLRSIFVLGMFFEMQSVIKSYTLSQKRK